MAVVRTVALITFLEQSNMLRENFHYCINKFCQQIFEKKKLNLN